MYLSYLVRSPFSGDFNGLWQGAGDARESPRLPRTIRRGQNRRGGRPVPVGVMRSEDEVIGAHGKTGPAPGDSDAAGESAAGGHNQLNDPNEIAALRASERELRNQTCCSTRHSQTCHKGS